MIFNYQLKFSDFSSKANFLKLQNKYAAYDEQNAGLNEDVYTEIVKTDFAIVYKSIDDFNIELYNKVYFYQDFLLPRINNLSSITILNVNKKIKADFLYNDAERNDFIKLTLEEVISIHRSILEADYLNPIIVDALNNELQIVIDFLSTFDFNLNFGIIEKIQFNLNKTDLLVLMYLFRKNGIVNTAYTDADFGKLIERFFQYQNSLTNNYVDIKRARKELNDFKNMNDTIEKSIARLKNLFQDNLFYQL